MCSIEYSDSLNGRRFPVRHYQEEAVMNAITYFSTDNNSGSYLYSKNGYTFMLQRIKHDDNEQTFKMTREDLSNGYLFYTKTEVISSSDVETKNDNKLNPSPSNNLESKMITLKISTSSDILELNISLNTLCKDIFPQIAAWYYKTEISNEEIASLGLFNDATGIAIEHTMIEPLCEKIDHSHSDNCLFRLTFNI